MQSGGIIIALSAVLWLAYLLPTWLHRRQYMATERNAVRLQQTLRILAETAEVPDAVRAETNARSVVEQQRALRRAAEEAEAAARARDAAAQRALPKVAPVSATSPSAATRLRRSRLAATAILALALVGVIAGIAQVAGAGAWTLLVISSLATFASLAFLQRMSQVAAARRLQAPEARPKPRTGFTDFLEQAAQPAERVAEREEGESWTPVPVPKPLYLSRSQAPGPRPGAGSAPRTPLSPVEEMRRAAAESEATLRRAHLEPEVARLSAEEEAEAPAASAAPAAPAARTAPVSRFSRMGIVDDAEPGMGDLDEVLRRRRAVG
ncbi:hypothetical protein HA387_11690 [Clavibacter michiganensis subsp. michiganensis]|uniref:hypothetical protein n=1 Tax=Clavibacter michiganensis TaxID=28447 RepID=UPI001867D272|nr:hypothetical protein [Clavibacter michiganensis]MBE3079074.1 hypothetical protein [Clavibacter michiganensis subsp. michiganensis]